MMATSPVSRGPFQPRLRINPTSVEITFAPKGWALSVAVAIIQAVKRHWPAIASRRPLPADIDAHVRLWVGAMSATIPAKAAVTAAEKALAEAQAGLRLAEVHLSAVSGAMPDMDEMLLSRMPI